MTTAVANLRNVFARDVLYQLFRRSAWLNLANRNWETDLAEAFKVTLSNLDDNVQIEGSVDRSGGQAGDLDASPVFSTAAITNVEMARKYMRATASLHKDDITAAGPGPVLMSRLADTLSKKLAVQLDNNLRDVITAGTYNAANDNLVEVGTAGSVFIGRAFPYAPTGTNAVKLVADALKLAHLKLFRKDVVTGETVGVGMPMPLAAIWQPEMGNVMAEYLEGRGLITDRRSIGGQAMANRGILGNTAYQGTFSGIMDLVASNSLAVPTGSGNWEFYVVPTDSAFVAAVLSPEVDDSQFGEGTTQGRYVWERTVVQKWGGLIVRQPHIIKCVVHAD